MYIFFYILLCFCHSVWGSSSQAYLAGPEQPHQRASWKTILERADKHTLIVSDYNSTFDTPDARAHWTPDRCATLNLLIFSENSEAEKDFEVTHGVTPRYGFVAVASKVNPTKERVLKILEENKKLTKIFVVEDNFVLLRLMGRTLNTAFIQNEEENKKKAAKGAIIGHEIALTNPVVSLFLYTPPPSALAPPPPPLDLRIDVQLHSGSGAGIAAAPPSATARSLQGDSLLTPSTARTLTTSSPRTAESPVGSPSAAVGGGIVFVNAGGVALGTSIQVKAIAGVGTAQHVETAAKAAALTPIKTIQVESDTPCCCCCCCHCMWRIFRYMFCKKSIATVAPQS